MRPPRSQSKRSSVRPVPRSRSIDARAAAAVQRLRGVGLRLRRRVGQPWRRVVVPCRAHRQHERRARRPRRASASRAPATARRAASSTARRSGAAASRPRSGARSRPASRVTATSSPGTSGSGSACERRWQRLSWPRVTSSERAVGRDLAEPRDDQRERLGRRPARGAPRAKPSSSSGSSSGAESKHERAAVLGPLVERQVGRLRRPRTRRRRRARTVCTEPTAGGPAVRLRAERAGPSGSDAPRRRGDGHVGSATQRPGRSREVGGRRARSPAGRRPASAPRRRRSSMPLSQRSHQRDVLAQDADAGPGLPCTGSLWPHGPDQRPPRHVEALQQPQHGVGVAVGPAARRPSPGRRWRA